MITRGDHTYGKIIHMGDEANCTFGRYCSIADNVTLILGAEHNVNWCSTYPFNVLNGIRGFNHPFSKGDIVIGNDVWIGYGAVILSGVTIGNGAVIGAMTVVRNNVEPYSVVIGNPDYCVKFRFTKNEIKKLEEMQWWNWEDEKVLQAAPLLMNEDVSALYDFYLKEVIADDVA